MFRGLTSVMSTYHSIYCELWKNAYVGGYRMDPLFVLLSIGALWIGLFVWIVLNPNMD